MKKSISLYLGLGLITIAITLAIFFIPRMGEFESITCLQYTKLGIIIASQVILFLNLILASTRKNMFSVLSTTSLTSFWFLINLVITLAFTEMQALITWVVVLFLLYLAVLLILTFFGGAIGDDMVTEKSLQEENKKKNLYKK